MNRVKVVHSHDVWLRPTENWLYNQVKYLNEDIEAYVICQNVENLNQFGVANLRQLDAPSYLQWCRHRVLMKLGLSSNPYHKTFLRELHSIKPSILHSHFGYTGWLDMAAAKKAKVKHIVTFYGWDVNKLPNIEPVWRRRYKKLLDHVDLVLCEGSFMAKSVMDLGCPEDKMKVHHLGIEVDNIRYKPRKWRGDEILRVLIAASFREKKGIPYALQALKELQDMVPLDITIVGDADTEPASQAEKSRILAAIENLKLENKVRMLGYLPHAALLKESYEHHIFIAPSVTARDGDSEGGVPVALIEMAATGMPVVSTKHCDIPEVIEDGETGLLAEERDVAGLAKKLRRLIENPAGWGYLVENARKHIEQEYSARTQGIRLSRIYKQVTDK